MTQLPGRVPRVPHHALRAAPAESHKDHGGLRDHFRRQLQPGWLVGSARHCCPSRLACRSDQAEPQLRPSTTAITASPQRSSGAWTVVMDCDLQEPPEEIPRLYYAEAQEGYEIVR